MGFNLKLSAKFNFGSYVFNITSTLHEGQTELYEEENWYIT